MSDAPDPKLPKVRVRTRLKFPGQVHPALEKKPFDEIDTYQSDPLTSEPDDAAKPDEYQVGYCRPPKHSQFQKGVSGNKKGRPKGSKNARTIAQDLLARKTPVTVDGKRQKMTALEIALLQQVKRATEKGDLKSLQYVASLAEGETFFRGSGSTRESTHPTEAGAVEELDAQDLAVLAYHRREQMLAKGIPPDLVELVMAEMGLVTGETAP